MGLHALLQGEVYSPLTLLQHLSTSGFILTLKGKRGKWMREDIGVEVERLPQRQTVNECK
jgi:hypothetical protein